MQSLVRLYLKFSMPAQGVISSIFLLAIRLYFGFPLARNGWAKLHNIGGVVDYFTSLNVPAPAFTAHMVSGLELVAGTLFCLGLGARLIAIPLSINMINAYYFGDHEAMLSFFSDPDKFTAAAPFTTLLTSLMMLVFGPGKFSIDYLIYRALGRKAEQRGNQ